MVNLRVNMQAVFFASGLDVIEQGYNAAVSGIGREINRRKVAYSDYLRSLESGIPPTEERDEDGNLIWSLDQFLEAEIEIAEEALKSFRNAYAVAIYHHWERSALQWTAKKSERHDKLVQLVRAMGYPIAERLNAVRDLVNLLKHNNSRWGIELYESWRDVFPDNFRVPEDGALQTSWYDAVALNADHINLILETIRKSGPTNAFL